MSKPAVTKIPDPDDQAIVAATDRLASLGVQVEATQAVLVRLLQDVAVAEANLDSSQAARLVEANGKLVVAALASQAAADAAEHALREAPEASTLDALTQLPNRARLIDRATQAIAHARRHESRFALLFVDLDNFKHLNDTRGHAFGDDVLCRMAGRMLAEVREVDTVSRHGGDEFVILLAQLNYRHDAQAVAEKLIAAIAAPLDVDGQAAQISASVGIAVYPDDGEDIDTLIAHADAAMYETKRRGDGGVAFHGETPALAAGRAVPPVTPARRRVAEASEADQRHAQLREANEQLVLAALNAQDLQATADQTRQRQAEFVAAVAEELRNPIVPIRIATAVLGRINDDEPLLPRVQGVIEEQMASMSCLVGNLVQAADTGAAEIEPVRRLIDMGEVVDAAVAERQPMMDKRGQRFESHRPPGVLAVQGDPVRLQQVVCNLLDNASKHSRDDGRISLSAVTNADTLTMTVTDDGIGITQQMLPHVFDTFVQDPHALGFPGVGLGIGLTVARILVQAHGGQLFAHSAGPGRGSQFVLMLPLAAAYPEPAGFGAAQLRVLCSSQGGLQPTTGR
jgi:diguanylate cyclase (GGDEF)-like protein